MRTPALVSIVIALHVLAVGAFVFIQGCESVRSRAGQTVEAPPPPVMPQRTGQTPDTERPIFRPPVEPTPPTMPQTMDGATHVVAKGETLSHIAKEYGISWRELAEYNNLADPSMLRVGDKLIVPPYAKKSTAPRMPAVAASPPPAEAPVVDRTGATTYVVQAGDNLTRIARRYGVKISDLRAANQLEGDMIRVGQKLNIPAAGAAPSVDAPIEIPVPADVPGTPPSEAAAGTDGVKIEEIEMGSDTGAGETADAPADQGNDLEYIVMDGDTLDTIAKLFIVSKQSLIEYNGLRPGEDLTVGEVIKIPPSAF